MPGLSIYRDIVILTNDIMSESLSARYTSSRYATTLSSTRVGTLE